MRGITKNRQQVLDFLDTKNEVLNWYAYFPNSIFIVSEKSASELSNMLRVFMPQENFLIVDIDQDRNGWTAKKAWDFIQNPKAVGEQ